MDIWFILYSIGLVQGVFLIIVLLLLRAKSRYAIGLLSLMLLLPLTLLLSEWLNILIPDKPIHLYFRGGEAIPLLTGPLFLLYTFSALKPKDGFKRKYLFHFIPFVVFAVLAFYPLPDEYKIGYMNKTYGYSLPLQVAIFSWFKGLHHAIYLVFSCFYVYKFKMDHKRNTSKFFRANMIYRLGIFQIIGLIMVYVLFTLQFLNLSHEIETDSISALYFAFSYFIFTIVLILSPAALVPDDQKILDQKRYNTSYLGDQEKQKILKKLEWILEDEKPYLSPDLKIGSLAARLEISSNALSQVINELKNMNFNQFINKYRIDAVKYNITDERKTLYGIALDHGFKSKSAFNRIFKEMTGLTPSSYKKKISK